VYGDAMVRKTTPKYVRARLNFDSIWVTCFRLCGAVAKKTQEASALFSAAPVRIQARARSRAFVLGVSRPWPILCWKANEVSARKEIGYAEA
jgi:hypothetical protein